MHSNVVQSLPPLRDVLQSCMFSSHSNIVTKMQPSSVRKWFRTVEFELCQLIGCMKCEVVRRVTPGKRIKERLVMSGFEMEDWSSAFARLSADHVLADGVLIAQVEVVFWWHVYESVVSSDDHAYALRQHLPDASEQAVNPRDVGRDFGAPDPVTMRQSVHSQQIEVAVGWSCHRRYAAPNNPLQVAVRSEGVDASAIP